ncbi:MAG TPA: class I SAM-dependent methyltransferase [Roseiflexaceae bacterium]|nr:class I SAM-dependent methyltransferase [Roseiflexaceae bacterium]
MEDIKGSVRRQFSPAAAAYATSPVHTGGPDLVALVAAAGATGRERALDVGSGAGHTALALAPYVASVTAVDLSDEMLAQGRALAAARGIGNITFQRGDVERLELPDAAFDIVTSRYSAHHYPRPKAALREVARVLRPGGTMLLVDVVAPEEPALDTFLNAIELLRDPSHVRDHTAGQWLAMLAEAGMTGELLGQWPLRLDFASWLARMRTPEPAAAQIRALLDGAPAEVRADLSVEPDHSFTVRVALMRGSKS